MNLYLIKVILQNLNLFINFVKYIIQHDFISFLIHLTDFIFNPFFLIKD
jgi:hypothetical protein